ncbi:MAG: hypothetical protein SF053_16080 [Bacteroidia bacterium]|nr:hypothetical protein [Bacteroidia bacterium]
MRSTLEFTIRIKKLLSIQMLHGYFADRVWRRLRIVPVGDTERILSNYGMSFKQVTSQAFSGLMVFYHPEKTLSLMQMGVAADCRLSFMILVDDQYYLNYSQLPFLDAGEVHHFSNLTTHTTKDKKKTWLHAGPVMGTPVQTVSVRPRTFDQVFSQDVRPQDIKLTTPRGEELRPAFLSADEAQRRHTLSLAHLPDGPYTLSGGGVSASLYSLEPTPRQCLGLVDIYLDPGVPAGQRLFDGKALTERDFSIEAETRSTYWRYYIIDKRDAQYADFEVSVKNKPSVSFSSPREIRLRSPMPSQEGTPALCITSTEPIPLGEQIQDAYELRMKKPSKGKSAVASIRLPVPAPENLKADKPEGKGEMTLFSDLYVYV